MLALGYAGRDVRAPFNIVMSEALEWARLDEEGDPVALFDELLLIRNSFRDYVVRANARLGRFSLRAPEDAYEDYRIIKWNALLGNSDWVRIEHGPPLNANREQQRRWSRVHEKRARHLRLIEDSDDPFQLTPEVN